MADDAIKARTFRLPTATSKKITEIGNLLSKNDTEVLIRAVDYLHENMKAVAESDFKARLNEIK